jgi:hypothetical protein
MANPTGKSRKGTVPKTDDQSAFGRLKEAGNRTEDSGVWIREDGAVCFGNECVVLSKQASGELNFEVDPSACGKETGKVVLSYLIDNLASQEPINIKVKPQKE